MNMPRSLTTLLPLIVAVLLLGNSISTQAAPFTSTGVDVTLAGNGSHDGTSFFQSDDSPDPHVLDLNGFNLTQTSGAFQFRIGPLTGGGIDPARNINLTNSSATPSTLTLQSGVTGLINNNWNSNDVSFNRGVSITGDTTLLNQGTLEIEQVGNTRRPVRLTVGTGATLRNEGIILRDSTNTRTANIGGTGTFDTPGTVRASDGELVINREFNLGNPVGNTELAPSELVSPQFSGSTLVGGTWEATGADGLISIFKSNGAGTITGDIATIGSGAKIRLENGGNIRTASVAGGNTTAPVYTNLASSLNTVQGELQIDNKTFTLAGGVALDGGTVSGTGTLGLNGDLTSPGSSLLSVNSVNLNGAKNFNVSGNLRVGTNTITGDLTKLGAGTFEVGENSAVAHTVNVNGSFTHSAGTLAFDIIDAEMGVGDMLSVDGPVVLNSAIAVNGLGDPFNLIKAQNGNSITLGPGFQTGPNTGIEFVDLGGGVTALQVSLVPEPASIALWSLLGLAGLAGFGLQRRWRPRRTASKNE